MKQALTKNSMINKKLVDYIMDELSCLFIVFLEVISFLIIVYFSINVAFSADSEMSGWSDRQHREITLSEISQGSLLYKTDTVGRYVPALTVSTDVEMKVTGMVARTKVTQEFKNDSSEWLEGLYVFPLPEDAAVDHLKMVVGERVIVGKIKPRAEAKKIYTKAKQEGKKASLIEQHRPSMFQNSVASIGPNETIKVVIEYQQTIQYQVTENTINTNSTDSNQETMGAFNLRFPLAINPRYIPGKTIKEKIEIGANGNKAGSGWAINTDQVPDASFITPPAHQPTTNLNKLNQVTLRVELDAGFPIESLNSASHKVSKVRHGEGIYTITLLPDNEYTKNNVADRDFNLKWQTAIGKQPRAAVFSEQHGSEFYNLVMIMPPTKFDANKTKLAREVVYILDTSGSMGGASIRQARKALLLAIDRLTAKETFNIIEFNSHATKLFTSSVQATHRNKVAAKRFVKKLQANGGTEMASALNLALNNQSNNKSDSNRIRQVIFLTDGSVGNEDMLFGLIKKKLGDSRLFTIGIGSAPNSYFMTKAAKFGRGTFTYIGDVNEVQQKMGELFSKLDSPILKNIKIYFNTNLSIESWPQQQPDLYLGEPIIVVTKSAERLNDIKLIAQLNNSQWQMNLNASNAKQNNDIGVLWARKKISNLMDSLQDGNTKERVKTQVTKIALQHHLVSKYTSLVAVDVTHSRPLSELLKKQALKTNLPKGMVHNKVKMRLAKTATAAQWNILKGSFLLFIALLMLWRQMKLNKRTSAQ